MKRKENEKTNNGLIRKRVISALLSLALVASVSQANTGAFAEEKAVGEAEVIAPAEDFSDLPAIPADESLFEAKEVDGIFTITKYKGNNSDSNKLGFNVVVPAVIDNHVVRAISGAFEGVWDGLNVYLPDSIVIIGENSFANSGVKKVGSYTCDIANGVIDNMIMPVEPKVESGNIIGAPDLSGQEIVESAAPVDTHKPVYTMIPAATAEPSPAPESEIMEPVKDVPEAETAGSLTSNFVYSNDLPKDLVYIYKNAFNNDKNLKEIKIGTNIKFIGDGAFFNSGVGYFEIPAGAKCIYLGQRLFNADLKKVDINGNVQLIAKSAFEATANLDTVTIGKDSYVEYIGENAFKNSGIHSFTIYGKVGVLGASAFEGASNIGSFTVAEGGSINQIGDKAFYCSGIHEVVLNGEVTKVGSYAFASCSNVDKVDINSTTNYTVGEYAFTDSGLHTVELSDGLSEVEKGTFEGCANLNTVELPNTLTHIGENAFKDVPNVTSFTMNTTATVDPTAFTGAGETTKNALVSTGNVSALVAAGLQAAVTPAPTTTPAVKAPAKVKLKKAKVNKKKKKVTLTWTKSAGADGYVVYKKVVKNKLKKKKAKKIKFKQAKTLKKTKVTLKIKKKAKTTFYIKAFAKSGSKKLYSPSSNKKTVKG